ncbi:MAG: membrane protein insertase YidC [Proteobacteria bacterium]|nr:membrane protein insertase YidC [Pseudomonadota bacterium]
MDNKNLLMAVVASVAIILTFQLFFAPPPPPPGEIAGQSAPTGQPAPETATTPQLPSGTSSQAPALPGGAQQTPSVPSAASANAPQLPGSTGLNRERTLASVPRIKIDSKRLQGSISLIGGRFDDLQDYNETIKPDSEKIHLLEPFNGRSPYYAQFWWLSSDTEVPNGSTLWTANRTTLTPENPVTLSWENKDKVKFSQTIALDANYMFTITQRVENKGTKSATVFPFGQILRTGTPDVLDFYILHEGLVGVFDGVLAEYDYDDVQDADSKIIKKETTGGWTGITDKYWLTALIPDQKTKTQTRYTNSVEQGIDRYRVDFLAPSATVAPNAVSESTNRLFAGAKEAALVDSYLDELGIERFDLAIDWGYFAWLTKPIFKALIFFNGWIGNMGLSILFLTVLIKLAFFPLANKSYRAMSKMKELQPEMMKIRDRYKEDRAKMNQEVMGLYKREKANPASGCLPILPQIPVFFALYKVLFVTIEMRHTPFFGWIQDLSAADSLTFVNLFGLIPFTPPEFAVIGVWPVLMGLTMYFQQKLNPAPTDPTQAKIFMFLPFIFTIMLARFPSGLVIYWTWNNSLSILQQYVIMKRAGVAIGGGKVKKTAPAAAAAGSANNNDPLEASATEETEADATEAKAEPETPEATSANVSHPKPKRPNKRRRPKKKR